MQIIYIEKAIYDHPRTQKIIQRCGREALIIECDHYGEVFNRHNQNFRLQKQKPALILAKKTNRFVLPTPANYGIGGKLNYYFSHMLNCIYDCRYCFLQGMYPSAHYVLFVNYEDFANEIAEKIKINESEVCYFFSGYDGDSLAFEAISEFVDYFLAFFSEYPKAMLELRTKSANIQTLLQKPVIQNCVIAFSFTPQRLALEVEHKTPPLEKRLKAMQALALAGWPLGIRLDPLIYTEDLSIIYDELISQIFHSVSPESVHSVSIGPLRFPIENYQRLIKLYPKDKFLAQPLIKSKKYYSYSESIEHEMKQILLKLLTARIAADKIYVI
jgi:spore photoproduct lyase